MNIVLPRRARKAVKFVTLVAYMSVGTLASAGDPPGNGEQLSEAESQFEERCTVCHDSGIPGIPTRQELSSFSQDYIVSALSSGLMFEQAYGLSDDQIIALATYVSTMFD